MILYEPRGSRRRAVRDRTRAHWAVAAGSGKVAAGHPGDFTGGGNGRQLYLSGFTIS